MIRCEGWTRKGGTFTMGIPQWGQCENEAVVIIQGTQDSESNSGKREGFLQPACMKCWEKAMSIQHIKISCVTPINEEQSK